MIRIFEELLMKVNLSHLIFVCSLSIASVQATVDNPQKNELRDALNYLHNLEFVDFEARINTPATLFKYHPGLYERVSEAAIFPKRNPHQVDKYLDILMEERNTCVASSLISFKNVLSQYEVEFKEIIRARFEKELNEVEMAKQWEKEAIARGYKYYGRSTTPYPQSTFNTLTFSSLVTAEKLLEKVTPFQYHEMSEQELDHELHVNMFKTPLINKSYLGPTNPSQLKWFYEQLADRYAIDFSEEDYSSCKVSPLRIAFSLGVRSEDIKKGAVDRIVSSMVHD